MQSSLYIFFPIFTGNDGLTFVGNSIGFGQLTVEQSVNLANQLRRAAWPVKTVGRQVYYAVVY